MVLRNTFSASLGVSVLLTLLNLITYHQVIYFDFVDLDDGIYVKHNPHIQEGITPQSIQWAFTVELTHASRNADYWQPITILSRILDIELYGLNAGGHHFTNLLIHCGNTVVLFLLLKRFTSHLWESALVAVLFSIHPLRVESVAWIVERKDVLSTFFGLLTIYAYGKFVTIRRLAWYFLAIVLYALALMSKAMVVTLPFLLILLDFWPLRKGAEPNTSPSLLRGTRESLRNLLSLLPAKTPFFILAGLSCWLTYKANFETGSVPSLDELPLQFRLMNAINSYTEYLADFFYPENLSIMYLHPERSIPVSSFLCSAMVLLAITTFAILRFSTHPHFFVGWFWYLGTLVPVIGLVQVWIQARADRFTYFPMIGWCIFFAWFLSDLVRWRPAFLKPTRIISVLFVGFLILQTTRQLRHWESSIPLFENAIRVDPSNWFAHHQLGLALEREGDYLNAQNHFARVVALQPNKTLNRLNLARVLLRVGRTDEAIQMYNELVKVIPHSAHLQNYMGIALARKGRIEEARTRFLQAVLLNPEYTEAYINAAESFVQANDRPQALMLLKKALEVDPTNEQARTRLSEILSNLPTTGSPRYSLEESHGENALRGNETNAVKNTPAHP